MDSPVEPDHQPSYLNGRLHDEGAAVDRVRLGEGRPPAHGAGVASGCGSNRNRRKDKQAEPDGGRRRDHASGKLPAFVRRRAAVPGRAARRRARGVPVQASCAPDDSHSVGDRSRRRTGARPQDPGTRGRRELVESVQTISPTGCAPAHATASYSPSSDASRKSYVSMARDRGGRGSPASCRGTTATSRRAITGSGYPSYPGPTGSSARRSPRPRRAWAVSTSAATVSRCPLPTVSTSPRTTPCSTVSGAYRLLSAITTKSKGGGTNRVPTRSSGGGGSKGEASQNASTTHWSKPSRPLG